jgi:hypothetical protein
MRQLVVGILCCVAATLSACNIAPDDVVMTDVNVRKWHKTATLEYDNSSEQERNLSIILHINNRFEAEHIDLQIKMFSPDSLFYTEDVHLKSAIEWSLPAAKSTDIEIPYRRNVSLMHKGKYTIHITPLESIRGVESVGMNFMAE